MTANGAGRAISIRAWAITTGEAGLRHQAVGLSRAAGAEVEERIVRPRPPGIWLPAGAPGVLASLGPGSDALEPPWPDLVVSCGRRAGRVALALKRRCPSALFVHVQDPQVSPARFDLVFAMPHDRVSGPNVTVLPTAIHHVTAARLAAARSEWAERLARLPRPLVGLVLGGPTRRARFDLRDARKLDRQLSGLRARIGGGLVVVPSRRTPAQIVAHFAQRAKGDPSTWVWDGSGDNPYLGVLALADRLVVTADSVSMVSEALAAHTPVDVFVPPLGRRHASFIARLEVLGAVSRLEAARPDARPFAGVLDAAEVAGTLTREHLLRRRPAGAGEPASPDP